jgi:hypothetical protein
VSTEISSPSKPEPAPLRISRDDALTLAAIAMLAFIFADVSHEIIGHGAAYVAVGGRSFILTTTRLIGQGAQADAQGNLFVGLAHGDLYGKIFSIGGPLGNVVFAALTWIALRFLHRLQPRARLFLWLATAFNLFWAFGYLMFSAVINRGDWMEAVRGLPLEWLWRVFFFLTGLALYQFSKMFLAADMRWFISTDDPHWRERVKRMVWISYMAGGIIACAGAIFDPRGRNQIYNSGALASFAAAIGLLQMPFLAKRYLRQSDARQIGIARSLGWIFAAIVAAALFVGVLGPGVHVSL